MNRPEPTCPTCEEDQRDRPPNVPTPTPAARKAPAVRPMAPLLDEEELAPAEAESSGEANQAPGPTEAIFDDPGQAADSDEI